MPIFKGLGTLNQKEIYTNGKSMQKVYCGDKLVWQKNIITYDPTILGNLYNGYAVQSAKNICAVGWQVLTREDAILLCEKCGETVTNKTDIPNCSNVADATEKLKSTTYWTTVGWNTYGFNLKGAGVRGWSDGTFNNINNIGQIWLNTAYYANMMFFQLSSNANAPSFSANNRRAGASVRVRRTTTPLAEGQEGLYVGNNGVRYKTKVIAGIEVITENLRETLYQDLTPITATIYTNAQWAALTTEAMCAYNDDNNNV